MLDVIISHNSRRPGWLFSRVSGRERSFPSPAVTKTPILWISVQKSELMGLISRKVWISLGCLIHWTWDLLYAKQMLYHCLVERSQEMCVHNLAQKCVQNQQTQICLQVFLPLPSGCKSLVPGLTTINRQKKLPYTHQLIADCSVPWFGFLL